MASSDLTKQLNAADTGWSSTPGELMDAIYPVLRRIAEARLRGESGQHTLEPTDLVHEAYLADDDTRAFIEDANPAALKEIAERLAEAMERGLWTPRSNSARALIEDLRGV